MATVQIKLEGFTEFKAKLSAISADVRGKIAKDAVDEGAAVIVTYAQLNTERVFSSKQRGQLRNSIRSESQITETGAAAEIGPHVIYGRIQEFGGTIRPVKAQALHFKLNGKDIFTKRVTLPARPYLRPAAEEHTDEIREAISASIRDNLEEFAV